MTNKRSPTCEFLATEGPSGFKAGIEIVETPIPNGFISMGSKSRKFSPPIPVSVPVMAPLPVRPSSVTQNHKPPKVQEERSARARTPDIDYKSTNI